MKAITYDTYGSPAVLKLNIIPRPQPADDEVLVKVHATTVTSGDRLARSLDMPAGFGLIGRLVFGIFRPRKAVLGTEFSGEVISTGKNVTRFRQGDKIIAFPGAGFGGYAEFATIAEDKAIILKPANLTYVQSAALSFGGGTALNFLRDKGHIQKGDNILIIGAAGSVGSAAVQLAKHFGANVTGVCKKSATDMVKSLGGDQVIDYSRADFTQNGETYDIILDTSGTATYARCEGSLKPNGRLLLVSSNLWQLLRMIFTRKQDGKKGIGGYAAENAEDLKYLSSMAEAGQFLPHIDKTFPLELMSDAHAYVQSGHKLGNVVVTVAPDHPNS